ARRMDVATMLTVLALKVGPDRAVASAVRTIPKDLATIGPLLQPIAFPRATREEARRNRHVMGELREALLARLPQAVVEPERVVGARGVRAGAADVRRAGDHDGRLLAPPAPPVADHDGPGRGLLRLARGARRRRPGRPQPAHADPAGGVQRARGRVRGPRPA